MATLDAEAANRWSAASPHPSRKCKYEPLGPPLGMTTTRPNDCRILARRPGSTDSINPITSSMRSNKRSPVRDSDRLATSKCQSSLRSESRSAARNATAWRAARKAPIIEERDSLGIPLFFRILLVRSRWFRRLLHFRRIIRMLGPSWHSLTDQDATSDEKSPQPVTGAGHL